MSNILSDTYSTLLGSHVIFLQHNKLRSSVADTGGVRRAPRPLPFVDLSLKNGSKPFDTKTIIRW